MKKLLLFLFWLLPFTVFAQQSHEGIFTADENWKRILKRAKAEQKYIFVNAVTSWSEPSKLMDKEVFFNKKIGAILNKNFISVKVQIDSTTTDNENIKSWYKDAKSIAKQAKVEAYPTFLFYNLNGELVFKASGFKDQYVFINLIKFVHDDEYSEVRKAYFDYQNGKRDFSKIPGIVKIASTFLGDTQFTLTVVKDYKKNYLDKLSINECLNKQNLQFMYENNGAALLGPFDNFFLAAYHQPHIVDSILVKPVSDFWVKGVISKFEIKPTLYKNNKPINSNPDWAAIKNSIQSKYHLIRNLDAFITDEKMSFYRKVENWKTYTLLKSEKLKNDPPKSEGLNVYFGVNNPAWDVFLHCNDKESLERALSWSELSIKLERSNVDYWDTKANLLYKLGRTKEAIECEYAAIELAKSLPNKNSNGNPLYVDEFLETIEKMKRGQETWK